LRCKRRAGEVVRSPPTPSPAASQVASLHLLVSHSEASHPAGAGSFPARARAKWCPALGAFDPPAVRRLPPPGPSVRAFPPRWEHSDARVGAFGLAPRIIAIRNLPIPRGGFRLRGFRAGCCALRSSAEGGFPPPVRAFPVRCFPLRALLLGRLPPVRFCWEGSHQGFPTMGGFRLRRCGVRVLRSTWGGSH
jgi:hypothetical protein